eukprot:gnl/TRDRNA2_/TRDRNA2_31513_c0_seq2.p2 gnl/TRDRNA2_/TRDRNA2_31513_c0~~gnl/TRDRNA2_/TRDRNA2_31513_c0_seq2.p2  ORF type:complete len:105 (+),score=17.42 gnl/TRDRNA2_/TRDRNA2_31513_c0_seq2:34-348(+)
MQVSCQQGSPLALELFQQMLEEQLQPEASTFLPAIRACERRGSWVAALQILEQMNCSQLMIGSSMFAAAIGACNRASKWQHALGLLEAQGHCEMAIPRSQRGYV